MKTMRTLFFGLVVCLVSTTAVASHYPLSNVMPAETAGSFAQHGITTTEQLLQRAAVKKDRHALAKLIGIKESELKQWVLMCDLVRIQGVGPVMVKLFAAAKVNSVSQLSKQQPVAFYAAVMKANDRAKITENPPSEKHLEHWIAQAKKLKVVVH